MRNLLLFFGTLLILWLLFIFWAMPADAVWLVIQAKVHPYPGTTSAELGSGKKNDIVGILPSGIDIANAGKKGCFRYPPSAGGFYVCVEITNKTKAQAKQYLANRFSGPDPVEYRRFYVDKDSLPQAIKDKLFNDGYKGGLDWATVKPYIIDKVTGVAIP